MKKTHLKILCLILLLFPACAWTLSNSLELRAGCFSPSSSLLRKIYSDGMFEFEIEYSRQIAKRTFAWANFNALKKEGRSTKMAYRTTMHLYPLSFGIKYQIQLLKCLFFYAGVGGSITWVNTHDRSPFVKRHLHKKGWGFVGKSSLSYFFADSRYLTVFVDYYDTTVSRKRGSLNIGGIRSGAGLGIIF